LEALEYDWEFWARPKQLPPPGDWLTWLLQTGRGFGKTRTGGSWVHKRAMEVARRWIALVAKTPADARDYMIEGPAGILRNVPPGRRPLYEPSKRRLTWSNGSWATVYSAEEADQLRGFSGDTAWLDEFGKYPNPREVWDNLQFGMREVSSDQPRVCITTTPRPLPILEELEKPTLRPSRQRLELREPRQPRTDLVHETLAVRRHATRPAGDSRRAARRCRRPRLRHLLR
jgi:phage terminase large subunit-like protein